MSKADENAVDGFRRALAVATRAIAGERELEVRFAETEPSLEEEAIILRELGERPSRRSIAIARGEADALALAKACHRPEIHRQLRPGGGEALEIFEALERVRVEAIGARRMAGVARNLDAKWQDHFSDPRYKRMKSQDEAPLSEAMALLLREKLGAGAIPRGARKMIELWRPFMLDHEEKFLAELDAALEDQRGFGQLVRKMLKGMDMLDEELDGEDMASEEAEEERRREEDIDSGLEDEGPDERREGDMESDMEAPQTEGHDGEKEGESEKSGEQLPEGEGEGERPMSELPPANASVLELPEIYGYQVYSREHDEIVEASELCPPAELAGLRAFLDRHLASSSSVIARLANRLQRRLMARQNRHWEFDLEEGVLDTARLTRVITDPLAPLSFKQESEMEFRDTVVTLLIDNSGSMRGRPIMIAACCADILARTLERCGVKVEILGFTTRAWKGGRAREKWMKEGRPPDPGRLNDLRHIIYKSADSPWRRARRNLGLMMREGVLKENIDGEALAWAHSRLLARPEQRRILMMISDGAPVDDSTLSANIGGYLENHLRFVIDEIERNSPVELLAIGIGHDVTRYYSRAVTITDVSELAGAMTDKLTELFGAGS
jgi:cobaltochelatase CobT